MAACAHAAARSTPGVEGGAVAGPAAASSLVGTYVLRQIDGHDLPAPFPGRPDMMISYGRLRLSADGTFGLTRRAGAPQPAPGDGDDVGGHYAVDGDVLVLDPAVPGERLHFTRSGAMLTLRDDRGNTWLYERR